MKKMKMNKLFSVISIAVLSLLVVACTDGTNKAEKIVDELLGKIEYQGDDSRTSVTGDLYFPLESSVDPNAEIEWLSENLDVIMDDGTVIRPNSNMRIKVEVFVRVDGKEASGSISFTVLKADDTGGNDPDPTPDPNPDPDVSDGKISTAEEFMAITDFSKNYELTNDIDFKGAEIKPLGRVGSVNWQGVVDPKGVFSSIFDGKGYALKNFTLTGSAHPAAFQETNQDGITSYMYVSIFPNLTGTVKNLAVVNATIVGDGFSGGIAGLVELNGKLSNVFFSGSITAAKSWGSEEGWEVPGGSIAGMLGGAATVENALAIPSSLMGSNLVTGYNFAANTSNIYIVNDAVIAVTEYATPEKGSETELLKPVNANKGGKGAIPSTFSHWSKYYN